jgi:hypothetical protein
MHLQFLSQHGGVNVVLQRPYAPLMYGNPELTNNPGASEPATRAVSARLAADAHDNVVAIWLQSEMSQGNCTSRIWSSTYTSEPEWRC